MKALSRIIAVLVGITVFNVCFGSVIQDSVLHVTTAAAPVTWVFYLEIVVMALIGIFGNLLLNATERDPQAPTTPYLFQIGFLIKDNLKRLLISLMITAAIIIGYGYIIPYITPQIVAGITGGIGYQLPLTLNPVLALLIGGFSDRIAQLLKLKIAAIQQVRSTAPTVGH